MVSGKKQIILGIDPGTIVLGYGIIEIDKQNMKLISMGVIQLSKYEDPLQKLRTIFEKISGLIDNYQPTACAIEAPFFGKNVQSMLKLGRAQGVAIAAALTKEVPVVEYSPKKIKQSITGNGNASKEQVAAMLQRLCKFELQPKFLDATDGLAAAVCHHFQGGATAIVAGDKVSGWGDFLAKNPKRLKNG
ncbi:MAG TPA: crossover junction endodeoxyribonuclease RuvC [Chitinophagales bacterium]|nr:crossover junction endodeoxyribonuclease RuvC [Chitinophagales bacterium]